MEQAAAAGTTTYSANIQTWQRHDGPLSFVTFQVGKYLFVPICPLHLVNEAKENLPSSVFSATRGVFATQEVWEKFNEAFGSKEARSGYASREALSDRQVSKIAERDFLRLLGGVSAQWQREFPGGNPFTGYAIYDLPQSKFLGRMACGEGYKPTSNYEGVREFPYNVYKAEDWSEQDCGMEEDPKLRGAAELQIGDSIDSRLPMEQFKDAYTVTILAAMILATTFADKVTQDGVFPRRLTVTLIDLKYATPESGLTEKEREVIAIKEAALAALGFFVYGHLPPKSEGPESDHRNYSSDVRAVWGMGIKDVKEMLEKHVTKMQIKEHQSSSLDELD